MQRSKSRRIQVMCAEVILDRAWGRPAITGPAVITAAANKESVAYFEAFRSEAEQLVRTDVKGTGWCSSS
jgi:hypothetical protein